MRFVSIPFRRSSSRPGFTLIEILVTIGIIVVLIGLTLPMLVHSRQTAIVIRTKSDLALIGTALEAYKTDFGDYPRFANPADDLAAATANPSGNVTWLDYATDRGARLLCFALISPGPANSASATDISGRDGADGPGFRVRRNLAGGTTPSGKVFGPYIDPSKFKLEYDTTGVNINFSDAKILDGSGNPILYYPAAGSAQPSSSFGYVAKTPPFTYTAPSSAAAVTELTATPLYNAFDNTADTTPSASGKPLLTEADMQTLLGDADHDGKITLSDTPPEVAVTVQSYLLWTAGADGVYGLNNGKSDDVCNFDLPPNLKK